MTERDEPGFLEPEVDGFVEDFVEYQPPEPYVQEIALFGGLACDAHRTSDAAVVQVLRDGIERVALASMGVELTWWTSAITPEDDLERGNSVTTVEGLDWSFVASRAGHLEGVTLLAEATALRPYVGHPKREPVVMHAGFPRPRPGSEPPVGQLRIGFSMHRWAMYGSGVDLARVVEPLTDWLLEGVDTLDADTGYLTLDRVSARDGFSPWEEAVQTQNRQVSAKLWGYGWGTLLSAAHVAVLGGIGPLQQLDWATVQDRPGGRAWLTLTRDITAVGRHDMRLLRELLAPALPIGSRNLQDYRDIIADPRFSSPDYLL